MSFIGRTLASSSMIPFTPATYDEPFRDRHGHVAMSITPDTAMTIPAVYACTTVVSEDIAKVPLQMFERITDGKNLASHHPLYDLLHDQPNEYQTAIEFREMMTAFALNREMGGIAKIIPGPRGPVDQLKPLHPDLVTRDVTDSGVLRYRYQNPVTRREEILLSEEVFVVRGRFGRSVLGYARESMALQLAMQRFATQSYQRGPRHTGIIMRDKPWPTDKARDNFRTAIDEYMGEGERAGRPMLLEDGMTWQSSGISMHDAEFLATMQHGVADVCRWYRVPQHKIQELLRSTNNNIEQQSIDYVVDSLVAWAVRWEQAIRRDLILNPQRFFAEHNLDGLLRGDSKTRAEANALAVQWGWLLRSEVRQRENLNPIPGMEEMMTPLNMGTGDRGTDQPPARQGAGPSSPAVASYLRLLVRDAAARVVRKEVATLGKLAESGKDWEAGVRAFYVEHAEFVARLLRVPDADAERYAQGRAEHLIASGPVGLDGFETATVDELTAATLDRAEVVSELVDLAHAKSEPLQLEPPRLSIVRSQRFEYDADGLLVGVS